MERIKRRTGFSETHEDHWKSFTDIFATVCLMFFFVLVVFGVLSSYMGNEATRLGEEAMKAQEELNKERAQLAILWEEFNEADRQRAELELENMSQQERLDMLWSALEDYRNRTVTDMEAAQAAFEAIGNAQTDMYRTIEERFNRIEDVSANYNEETGRLEISADILFDRNQDAIKPEYVDRVRQMGEVFFDIIDEYTASGGENMARLEYIEIIGHTDMTSTGSANRGLSQRRAASFIQVFLPDGSSAESEYAKYFKSSGMSKFEPAEGTVTNQTTAQMDANRRVEVRIVFDERDVQRSIAAIADTMSQARDRTDEIFDLPEDGAQMQPPLLPEAGDGR